MTHRPSLLTTQSEIIEESKAQILMAKVKQLYQKLATQISENQLLLEENQSLKLKLSEYENKSQQSQSNQIADQSIAKQHPPVFSLFLDKINSLENQNKKLKEQKERNSLSLNQWCLQNMSQNQNHETLVSRRPSIINQKMMSPQCSTTCFFSNQQSQNMNIPIGNSNYSCYSPRNYNSNMTKRASQRVSNVSKKQLEIDRLWLSPNRKNLQKLINMSRNK